MLNTAIGLDPVLSGLLFTPVFFESFVAWNKQRRF
jgi:hypothetical protein